MKKFILIPLIPLLFACSDSRNNSLDNDLQKLKDADKNWAKACESKDVTRMIACYDSNAFFVQETPIRGIENLTKFWQDIFKLPEYFLTWQVEDAKISVNGDLGYTSGLWQQQYKQNGELIKSSGRYLAVWQKQLDGSWKVLVDKP